MSQKMTKRRRRRGCVNVDRVKAYIEANHCKRLTWDHLEQHFNRSRSAIHAALKRYVGKGFMELLHQARIRQARYMLRRSRLTLPAIGGRCGYAGGCWTASRGSTEDSHRPDTANNTDTRTGLSQKDADRNFQQPSMPTAPYQPLSSLTCETYRPGKAFQLFSTPY